MLFLGLVSTKVRSTIDDISGNFSMVSDGQFLYLFHGGELLKISTGLGNQPQVSRAGV